MVGKTFCRTCTVRNEASSVGTLALTSQWQALKKDANSCYKYVQLEQHVQARLFATPAFEEQQNPVYTCIACISISMARSQNGNRYMTIGWNKPIPLLDCIMTPQGSQVKWKGGMQEVCRNESDSRRAAESKPGVADQGNGQTALIGWKLWLDLSSSLHNAGMPDMCESCLWRSAQARSRPGSMD